MSSRLIKIIFSAIIFALCTSASFTQNDAAGGAKISETNTTEAPANNQAGPKNDIKTAKQDSKDEAEDKKVKWIKETIQYGIQSERRNAVNMILSIKDESSKDELCSLLIETLKDEYNNEVTVRMLTVLADLKVKRAEERITARINDDSEDVSIAAIYALKSIEAVAAKDKLIEKLKQQKFDTDSRITEPLFSTLGAFKAAELMPFIKEQINNNESASVAREQMTLFLCNIDSPESKELLTELYTDEEEEISIRCFAVNGLAKLESKESAEDINNVLNTIETYPFKKKQRYHNLMIYSVTALVKLGDDRAIPRLMDYLKSDNVSVRLKAVELIKDTGDKRTIDILKYKMKYDSEIKVKKAAENALEAMGVDTKK